MAQGEKMNLSKQTLTKSLVYLALSLMLINFILLFLPCIEYRMPSYKETTIFGTEYKGWYTEGVSPFKIAIPAIVFGLPLALSILTYFSSRSTQLNRITSDTVTQPSRFLLLKFGAIVNVATIYIANAFFRMRCRSMKSTAVIVRSPVVDTQALSSQ